MRLKEFFTIPEGQKIKEKHLRRVLISSICSILLCMTGLVSTTWALFAVSLENAGNVIQIAKVEANVTITNQAGAVIPSVDGSYTLGPDTYTIHIKLENDATDAKIPVYVLMSVTGDAQDAKPQYYYFEFPNAITESNKTFAVGSGTVTVNFSEHWMMPVSAAPVGAETLTIGELPTEPPTEPPATEPPTEPPATEPPTEPPVTESPTEPLPTEINQAETTPATEPSTEATASADPAGEADSAG